jgi:hypothetical protein
MHLKNRKIMSAAQALFEKTAEGAIAPHGHVFEISRQEEEREREEDIMSDRWHL